MGNKELNYGLNEVSGHKITKLSSNKIILENMTEINRPAISKIEILLVHGDVQIQGIEYYTESKIMDKILKFWHKDIIVYIEHNSSIELKFSTYGKCKKSFIKTLSHIECKLMWND